MKEIDSNYYDVLEVLPSASVREITKAYLRLKAAYGENSLVAYTGVDDEERRNTLSKVEEAYLILSRSEKRREYDNAHNFDKASKSEESNPKVRALIEPRVPKYRVDPEIENEILNRSIFDGAILKKIREYKRITLEDISRYTKIARRYFEMIEGEEFSSFTATAYMRGFLKEYAKYLKLDPTRVCNSYLERIDNK